MRIGIIMILAAISLNCLSPSEDAMLRKFAERQALFEELIRLLQEEPNIVRVTNDQVLFADGEVRPISQPKFGDIRELIEQLRLEGGVHRAGPERIRLIATRSVPLVVQESKDFLYTTSPPGSIVESIDKYEGGLNEQAPVYRRITENWYLMYERW